MIAPHRQNRTKKKTQDGRRLRAMCGVDGGEILRFTMAASSDHSLGLYPENFLGFVQLASILILLKQFQF